MGLDPNPFVLCLLVQLPAIATAAKLIISHNDLHGGERCTAQRLGRVPLGHHDLRQACLGHSCTAEIWIP